MKYFAERMPRTQVIRCNSLKFRALKEAFNINPDSSTRNIRTLATSLGLTTHAVQMWFYRWQIAEAMKMNETEPGKYDILTNSH